MKKLIAVLVSVCFINLLVAQDTESYKATIDQNKIIYSGNTIKLFAGQRIIIAKDLEALKLVDTSRSRITNEKITGNLLEQNSQKDICIDFNIVTGEDGKSNTYLIVNNPFKDPLIYKAKIFSRRANEYVETSIWDVTPGVSGIEHWPYAITDIILYDFKIKK